MQSSSLKDDLQRAEAYAELLREDELRLPVELVQTHISWVFLIGEHVFKLKRPVNFGFLDFSNEAARHRACLKELTLNRRLAAEVYLDVLPVTLAGDGRPRIGGDGKAVDWVVYMKRLPDARRADNLLRQGGLGYAEVDRVAEALASFHATASIDDDAQGFGSQASISANVDENFAQTQASIGRFLEPSQADELRRFQYGFLSDNAFRFAARVQAGRVRDGHGDLRLEHVYLVGEQVAVIDCIEFNERFRYGDVCADIAFLSMDLCEEGRLDLAERLLARYALLTDDFDLYALVDFYRSYRAHVRAKVATFVALADDTELEARERAVHTARRHYLLALSAARRPIERPCVIAVAGLIASGKSSVADRLGAKLGAPVVVADRVRKALSGVSAETPLHSEAFAGHYSRAASETVYRALFERAQSVLRSGRSVVLDASFRATASRSAARELARQNDAAFCLIECRCPREIAIERLRQRESAPSVSDGRAAIFDEFAGGYEPITELSPEQHRVLDTTAPLEQSVSTALAALFGIAAAKQDKT